MSRSRRGQSSVFQWDTEMRRAWGTDIDEEEDESKKKGKSHFVTGPRGSYQHMAGEYLKKAMSLDAHQETWNASRSFLFHVLDSPWYSIMMGVIILLNTVLVIHEVDSMASGPGVPGWVGVAASVFLTIYSLEIAVRFYVLRLSFFKNSWNTLDLAVVITDICAEVANMGGLNELPSVSVLRIFRLVRLVRLILMLSVFPELQAMLLGFGSAMRAMLWASLLIMIVVTVCSICAVIFIHPLNVEVAKTGVYEDCERCGRAFETVAESNLTFIQQIIAGDSWGQITIPIIKAYPLAGAFFLLVFGVIDLGVINLVLMVIVNAAETARVANQDMQFRKKIGEINLTKQALKHLCKDLDINCDGRISLDEFKKGLDSNEALRKALAGLDIQRQDAELIFYMMDQDESGDVDFHEFVGTLVETKHESFTTKHLFLKASIQQIYKDLNYQSQLLEEDDAKARTQQFAEVVKTIHDEASSEIRLQWKEIMTECQLGLAQKLDQRWEQLQVEQAQTCHMLERAVGEMQLLLPSADELNQLQAEAQSSVRESKLPSLSFPPAGATGQAEQRDGPKWCATLCKTNEPSPTRRVSLLSPAGRDIDMAGNDYAQRGLVLAQSVLPSSKNNGTAK